MSDLKLSAADAAPMDRLFGPRVPERGFYPHSHLDRLSPFAVARALRWLEREGWKFDPSRDGWVKPMVDIRDGERLPNIRGKQAYRQPDGQIALWDGERHVIIGPNREGLRVALQQMKLAREYASQRAARL